VDVLLADHSVWLDDVVIDDPLAGDHENQRDTNSPSMIRCVLTIASGTGCISIYSTHGISKR
jgi:hypothetical protein